MNYKVKLDNFEGPLDLLLYFIQRDKLNIYDISISYITKEYLDFINLMKKMNIEVAGEFIVMASMLMRVKSRMLLPRIENSFDEQLDDPRTELIRRIVEYKQFKEASEDIKVIYEEHSKVYQKGMKIQLKKHEVNSSEYFNNFTLFDLITIFNNALKKQPALNTYETNIEEFHIDEKISFLLDIFSKTKNISFKSLVEKISTKLEIIVTFLALLELVRNKKIKIFQKTPFSKLIIAVI